MQSCLFCKIVAGDIPSVRVYEDGDFVAFLDIGPNTKGHTLVVPKAHERDLLDAHENTLVGILKVTQRLAAAVLQATGAEGFNLHVNNGHTSGQEIDHLHLHIIPRFKDDSLKHWPKISYADGEMEMLGDSIREKVGKIEL